ncbi:MAG: hypothetical protein ACE5FO_05960 [Parvularculaceae bacterium]
MQVITKSLAAATSFLIIFGCERAAEPQPTAEDVGAAVKPGAVNADVTVTITPDGAGGYSFKYSNAEGTEGNFSDEHGNLNFSDPLENHAKGHPNPAKGHPVLIRFAIADGSVDGIKFMPDGEDAMWIALADDTGPDGSPEGPFNGDQFFNFATEAGDTRLHVSDRNNDGNDYRYALRFTLDGEPIQHDPDIKND